MSPAETSISDKLSVSVAVFHQGSHFTFVRHSERTFKAEFKVTLIVQPQNFNPQNVCHGKVRDGQVGKF